MSTCRARSPMCGNFMAEGVNAIIINPNSPTAFDPVFAQAKDAGILVISTDAEVSSPDAVYVGIDQKAWAANAAKWLARNAWRQGQCRGDQRFRRPSGQ